MIPNGEFLRLKAVLKLRTDGFISDISASIVCGCGNTAHYMKVWTEYDFKQVKDLTLDVADDLLDYTGDITAWHSLRSVINANYQWMVKHCINRIGDDSRWEYRNEDHDYSDFKIKSKIEQFRVNSDIDTFINLLSQYYGIEDVKKVYDGSYLEDEIQDDIKKIINTAKQKLEEDSAIAKRDFEKLLEDGKKEFEFRFPFLLRDWLNIKPDIQAAMDLVESLISFIDDEDVKSIRRACDGTIRESQYTDKIADTMEIINRCSRFFSPVLADIVENLDNLKKLVYKAACHDYYWWSDTGSSRNIRNYFLRLGDIINEYAENEKNKNKIVHKQVTCVKTVKLSYDMTQKELIRHLHDKYNKSASEIACFLGGFSDGAIQRFLDGENPTLCRCRKGEMIREKN